MAVPTASACGPSPCTQMLAKAVRISRPLTVMMPPAPTMRPTWATPASYTHLGEDALAGLPGFWYAHLWGVVDGQQGEGERRAVTLRAATLVIEQEQDMALIENPGKRVVRG